MGCAKGSRRDASSPEHYAAAFELQAAALEWSARWGSDRTSSDASDEYDLLVFEAGPICYLWPLNPHLLSRLDPDTRLLLRRWYLLGADEFSLATNVRGRAGSLVRPTLYQQLARCISAIRGIVDPRDIRDEELSAAHGVLRTWAERDRSYIHRHMRPDDPADPHGYDAALDEFQTLLADVTAREATQSRRGTLLHRIREVTAGFTADTASPVNNEQWQRLGDLVAELIDEGEPPTSVELRTRLAPVLEHAPPGDIRAGLRTALEAARPRNGHSHDTQAESGSSWSAVVAAAREVVAGRTLLIVGGQNRPDSMANIERALACRVVHECPGPHASLRYLADTVRGVGIVLLLIRFASHSFKPQLTRFCRAADTPLVIVPAGYGVEQVAAAIMDQASLRL